MVTLLVADSWHCFVDIRGWNCLGALADRLSPNLRPREDLRFDSLGILLENKLKISQIILVVSLQICEGSVMDLDALLLY